jgi:hypothetical protein
MVNLYEGEIICYTCFTSVVKQTLDHGNLHYYCGSELLVIPSLPVLQVLNGTEP